ncbi:MAG: SGNH/GDSL hydrolase family protein, partial [Lachnospiraceae bacterium]|nr:SGNH/GDSL hydrolase family protein [Lachnospiraceae bacterium]
MQRGPVAPKDPVMKKPFFYIMQDKDIYGDRQPDGTGVQFIYQNDNRLLNSAGIVGNVTDENMLNLLKTTAGFRELVYAIGVSVTESSGQEKVRFVYQMYGRTDTYGSGTNLVADMITDGMEQMLYLDDVKWSIEDKEPGQIRFEFEHSDVQATASVRFYLRDGFQAPEAIVDEAIDEQSSEYEAMIQRSLLQLGNTARLQRVIQKARAGE